MYTKSLEHALLVPLALASCPASFARISKTTPLHLQAKKRGHSTIITSHVHVSQLGQLVKGVSKTTEVGGSNVEHNFHECIIKKK